jgi:hypothetical protein
MQPLTKRWSRAFERSHALRAQQNRNLHNAKTETERTRRLLAQIEALRAQLLLRPRSRFDEALQAIEISERHGTLEERTAILLLADALCHASDDLERMFGC